MDNIFDYTYVFLKIEADHDWGKPTYKWADDNSTCTATHVCKNDSSHVETETVKSTSKVTKKSTSDKMGETTYTATFTNAAFTKQTKTVANIPKLPLALKSATAKDQTYTGKALKPKVTVKDSKGKTVPASAYTVTYTNNTKLGKATATITAKKDSGYTGTVKATFAIKLGKTKRSTVAHVGPKTMDVKFTKVTGATSYQVQWRKVGASWKTKSVKSTKTTLSGLAKGKLYDVRVRAVAGLVKGAWSVQAHRWLMTVPNVKATAGKNGALKVSWGKVAKANAGYEVVVRYSKHGKVVTRQAVAAGKTSVTIKGLKAGKNAWVQVRPLQKKGGATYVGVLTRAKAPVKVAGGSTSTKSSALKN